MRSAFVLFGGLLVGRAEAAPVAAGKGLLSLVERAEVLAERRGREVGVRAARLGARRRRAVGVVGASVTGELVGLGKGRVAVGAGVGERMSVSAVTAELSV